MSEPTTKQEIPRFQDEERIDIPDFMANNVAALALHEAIVGALGATKAVLAGFDATALTATTLRVTKGTNGAFIAVDRGGSDRPWPVGVDSASVLLQVGGAAAVDYSFTGLTPDVYHVSAMFAWVAARYDQRAFWHSDPTEDNGGHEYPDSMNTRYVPQWSLDVRLHSDAAPVGGVRVATVIWDGSDMTGEVYKAKQMLFEGASATGDGSTVAVPASGAFAGFAGPLALPEFSRDDDRVVHGVVNLSTFAQAVLKSIEEVKDPAHGGWWRKPPKGLSIRSAQPVTVTIGTGEAYSTGNYNATALVSGYWNIDAALAAIVADMNASILPQNTVIALKPGAYQMTAAVEFPYDVGLVGAGVRNTTLKVTDAGQFTFGGGATGFTAEHIRLVSALTTAIVSYNSGMNVWLGDLIYDGGSSAILLQNADVGAANGADIIVCNVQSDGALRCETPCHSLQVYNSRVSDITGGRVSDLGVGSGNACPKLTLAGVEARGVHIYSTVWGVRIHACTIGTLYFSGKIEADVKISGVTFAGDASIAGAAQSWRVYFDNIASTRPSRISMRGCEFVAGDDVSGIAVAGAAGASHMALMLIDGCAFMPDSTHLGYIGTQQAVSNEGPADKVRVRNCVVVDFAHGAFWQCDIADVYVHKTIDAALISSVFDTCSRVRRAHVESALTSCDWLMHETADVEDCIFDVPVTPGAWAVDCGGGTSFQNLIRCRFPQGLQANWSALAGPVDLRDSHVDGDCILTLNTGNRIGLVLDRCEVHGNLEVATSGTADAIGLTLRGNRTLVSGWGKLDGNWNTVSLVAGVFENGLRVRRVDGVVAGGTCEVIDCVLWPRGDASGAGAPLGASGDPFPALGCGLTVSYGGGEQWGEIYARGNEFKGKLDSTLYDGANNISAVVSLLAIERVVFEDNQVLMVQTENDADVGDFGGISLYGRLIRCRKNTIRVENPTTASRTMKCVFAFHDVGYVGGNVVLSTSMHWALDDNTVEFNAALDSKFAAILKEALWILHLTGTDVGAYFLASLCRNTVHVTSFDSSTVFAKHPYSGDIGAAHSGGIASDNVIADRANHIAAIDIGTVTLTKPGGGDLFSFGTNVIAS